MNTITHDHYVNIKARAVELLTSPKGFNGFRADEIKGWRGVGSNSGEYRLLKNAIGVAVIRARDEVQLRVLDSAALEDRGGAINKMHFTKAHHRKIEAEIARDFRSGAI
jgi:hypothetical protein